MTQIQSNTSTLHMPYPDAVTHAEVVILEEVDALKVELAHLHNPDVCEQFWMRCLALEQAVQQVTSWAGEKTDRLREEL